MPSVLFTYPHKDVFRTARMFTPKQITKELAWLKAARVVIPIIPDPSRSDWRVLRTEVTINKVQFDLCNSIGHTASVIIDRRRAGFG